MQPSTLAKRVFPFVFFGIIVFYLYGLGSLPLVGPDEPRYAQVAREMFLRHDLITPTLGGHNWFEKPALLYWMMIAAYKTFGVSEWSARIGPALSGLLTIVAVWLLAREIERKSGSESLEGFGYFSAFAAATSLGLIVFSHGASFDVIITMTTTWALSFFFLQEVVENRRNRHLLLAGFYVFVGLSLIAKGLVGVVIPFGVTTLYYLLRRCLPDRTARFSLIWGIPLALFVSAVWYGPVIYIHGRSFINEFFIQHHLARYISNKYHHPQPFYFYLPVLILMSLPWTAWLVEGLAHIKSWRWREDAPINKARIFALAWLIFPILFFSFSASKLPGYVLPALPATAIFVGERVARSQSRWTTRSTGIICLALTAAALIYAYSSSAPSLWHVATALIPLLIAGVLSLLIDRRSDVSFIAIGSAILITLAIILTHIAPELAARESVRNLLQLADARGYGNAPVFARRGSDRTAEFYASSRVVYDASGEPVTLDEFPQMRAEVQKQGGRALVLLPSDNIEMLKNHPEIEVIGSNGSETLVGINLN